MLNKAVIDLNVLRNNAKDVKSRLKGGARFNAVVKANAYGHGDAECANALYDLADSFSVALAEEGVKLRRAGIDKEILVLVEPFPEDMPSMVKYALTASVSHIKTLARARQGGQTAGRVRFGAYQVQFGHEQAGRGDRRAGRTRRRLRPL